ncbi:unnamed protein product [Fraxinus pennsylvanica]|uniref:Uncharacterized protein n=1 Tax=Fraxinus pennsylvanica TaxID=56036 RepID=A0AAD1YXE0_9LAMI|nr:unnamed protein product [Fraxinus pennsylvanica]
MDIPQEVAPPPPPIGADIQILRQMFATMTGCSRDIHSLQQAFGALRIDMQQVYSDMQITPTFASDSNRESLASRRAFETMNGQLSLYAGRVDGLHLQADETCDRLDSLETEVRRHSDFLQKNSDLLRGHTTLLQEQSRMLRQLLALLDPPPDDSIAGHSFLPPSPPPPYL